MDYTKLCKWMGIMKEILVILEIIEKYIIRGWEIKINYYTK